MTYTKPIAKWQMLLAKHYAMPDVLKMTYNDARDYLAMQGYRLIFANTVQGPDGGMLYVAVIDGPDDWLAFVTEAIAQWRRNVRRFTFEMNGREQIQRVLSLGGWKVGMPVTQQDARLLAGAVIFTRDHGVRGAKV